MTANSHSKCEVQSAQQEAIFSTYSLPKDGLLDVTNVFKPGQVT